MKIKGNQPHRAELLARDVQQRNELSSGTVSLSSLEAFKQRSDHASLRVVYKHIFRE